MRIVLIGLNHQTAPVELRERVAFTIEDAERATGEMRDRCGVEEVVVLSTCNRSELYGVRRDPEDDPAAIEGFLADFHGISRVQLNGCLYLHRDIEAVRHLYRVAAGLDSMVLGEAEILGQVREAYRHAADAGSTGPVLNRIFQGAIEVGRRVRAETEIGTRPMSAASAGVKLAERVFGDLPRRRALVLGSGEMAQQVVEQMRHRGIRNITVTSRTAEHAQQLAQRFEADTLAWEDMSRALGRPDLLVASVSAEQPVLTGEMLSRAMDERENQPMFLLDLGVPRNIDPAAAEIYNLYLYDIDDLTDIVEQNRRAREREIPRAEAIIAAQISKFEAWRAGRGATDLVDDLRSRLDERRRHILEAHAAAFSHLGPEEREHIDQLTAHLVDELLKEPCSRLRHARTWRERVHDMETVRELFGLDKEKE
jgi:glutamyl-tRNA reductase